MTFNFIHLLKILYYSLSLFYIIHSDGKHGMFWKSEHTRKWLWWIIGGNISIYKMSCIHNGEDMKSIHNITTIV